MPRPALSMLADIIACVEKAFLQGLERPSGDSRSTLPRLTRRGFTGKAQIMRMNEEGPHGGPMVWLMAVLVVALAAKVDATAADITVLAIGAYAMASHNRAADPFRPPAVSVWSIS